MKTLQPVLLALIVSAGMLPAAETPNAEPVKATDPAKLIEKLNSDDFDARDAAARELAKLGEAARPVLEKAFASGDPDTKDVIQSILAKMSQSVLFMQACDRDGKPVADAQADAQIYDAGDIYNRQQNMQSITTAADGTAQLPPCKPGTYQVYFTWKKCQPVAGGHFGGQFKLLEGRNRVLCVLSPGGTLQFQITGEDGKPVKDARVATVNSYYAGSDMDADALAMVAQQQGRQDGKSADSDANGIAKLEGVPQGIVQCLITHESFETFSTPLCRVHDGQITDAGTIKLKAKAPGKLQLILTKDDDKPLAKTSVLVTLKKRVDPADEKKAARGAIQARMWFGGFNQQQGEPTDEAGKLLKDNVASGTYRLIVQTGDANGRIFRGRGRSQGDTLQFVSDEVVIKPGETTEVKLKPLTGISLSGKVLTEKGTGVAYATVCAIPEADYINAGPELMSQYTRYNYGNSPAEMRYEQTGNDGAYKFSRMKAGRYVVTVQSQSGESAIIYGVELTEGKDLTAPEVKFPSPAKSFKEVKVHVSLPDGHPAVGATVNVATVNRGGGWSSSGSQTDSEGNMRHNIGDYSSSQPNKVSISLAGYHPVNLDLNSADIKPEDISVTLQTRIYQKLTVKTVDEAGKPVAGVQIWPFGKDHVYRHNNNPNANPNSRMKRTDKEGQVHFDGLIDGKRSIRLECDGYFADEASLSLQIGTAGETQHTIVLHKGLSLSGKVQMPEGVSAEQANAVLNDQQGITVRKAVNANGEFQFTGLAPGEYNINAEAPGCNMGCAAVHVALEKDKPAAPAALTLIHHGGVAVGVGVERSGMNASLFPVDFWKDPDYSKFWAHQFGSDSVDAKGRAELWAPPGSYMIRTAANQARMNYDAQNQNAISLDPLAGPVTVQALKTSGEMTALATTDVQFPHGTGTVTLTVVPEYPAGVTKEKLKNTYVSLLVVGQKATGSVNYNRYANNNRQNEEKPVIIGTPPAGLKPRTEQNEFTIKDVPEGSYKIFIQPHQKRGEPKQPMKSLLEFSVKDGETVKLGEIKVQLPAPGKEELDQEVRNDWWMSQEDDKLDEFKP